ncbi:MAG: tetrahydrofolate dehydrogenase/cyclohydrolase catalytic domain-containing protein, partial [Halanaerobium sp.]
MAIIDGKAIAEEIRGDLKEEVNELKNEGRVPGLSVVLVGNNPA